MSECTHDCSSCSANCPSKNQGSLIEPANELSSVRHVIGVVSGKGGVGKSLVTSMLAILTERKGYHSAILDADITGPSIPKAFGIGGGIEGDEHGMFPARSNLGIDIMSTNLLLDDETTPVVWRGPVISGTVKQFWTDVIWDGVEYMFVDCPPGTGDVPLTVFQSLPLSGIVIVTSPQELVSMIVKKAANMANMMSIPVLGVIENMSYVRCPDCGKEIKIFGDSKINEVAKDFGYDLLARIPIDPRIAELCDAGKIEEYDCSCLDAAADAIIKKTNG